VAVPHRGAVAGSAGVVREWNTVYKTFDRWAQDGTWQQVLTAVQACSDAAGDLGWVTAVASTITRVHQHGATLSRTTSGANGTRGLDRITKS
jgi:transposase